MKERIKEIAVQSQLAELYDRYMDHCMRNSDDDILDFDEVVNKFAELIVRECVAQCDTERQKFVELANQFVGFTSDMAIGSVQSSERIAEEIKKHFGIE